jgi:hypothetical protein
MTVPERPRYAIRSSHPKVVPDGARVTYELVRTNVSAAEIDPPSDGQGNPIFRIFPPGHPYRNSKVVTPRVRWRLESDPAALATGADTITEGPEGTEYEWTLTLDDVGDHVVSCEVEVPSPWASQQGEVDVFERVQKVTLAARRIAEIEQRFGFDHPLAELYEPLIDPRPRDTDDPVRDLDDYVIRPEVFLARVERLIALQEHIEQRAPSVDATEAAEGAALLKKHRRYRDALRKLVWRDHGTSRSRIQVAHFVRERGEEVERFVYISIHAARRVTSFAEVDDPDDPADEPQVTPAADLVYFVTIVDWTDPVARGGSGVWRGAGSSFTAIRSALAHWRTGNRYPAGTVVFDLPGWVDVEFLAADEELPRRFDTSGGTFVEDLTAWMDGASVAVGLLALVGLVLAPVVTPVAGMLWASLAGSSAAAAIRLVDRRLDDNLAESWKEDALDLLTIAANLAAVPGVAAAWRRGARVMLPAAAVTTDAGVLQMAFVGQIVAEGAQGVLITVDGYEKVQATLDDTSLSAPERSRRILTLLANLTLSSALLGVSIRGNISELRGLDDALARGIDPLGDPDSSIDLTKPDRSRGDTADGDHEIEIDVDPPATLPTVDPISRLSSANEVLARGADDATKAALGRMLDTDGPSVDLLMTKYGTDVAAHADAFVAVWSRAKDLRVPPPMLRVYHEHTGLTGIDYLAGLHVDKPAITDEEILASMWAARTEQQYRDARDFAGHSIARHGAHATDAQLQRRISSGVAPDGEVSHTRTSTRFLTNAQWLLAHDAAGAIFRREFKARGVEVDVQLPRDDEGLERCKVVGVFEMHELLAHGFDHIGPHSGSGSHKTWATSRLFAPSELDLGRVQVKFGWTGSEWIPIQLFGVPNTKMLGWDVDGLPGASI